MLVWCASFCGHTKQIWIFSIVSCQWLLFHCQRHNNSNWESKRRDREPFSFARDGWFVAAVSSLRYKMRKSDFRGTWAVAVLWCIERVCMRACRYRTHVHRWQTHDQFTLHFSISYIFSMPSPHQEKPNWWMLMPVHRTPSTRNVQFFGLVRFRLFLKCFCLKWNRVYLWILPLICAGIFFHSLGFVKDNLNNVKQIPWISSFNRRYSQLICRILSFFIYIIKCEKENKIVK